MDVTLVLTHDCNLACPYCYMGEKFDRRMKPDVAARALAMAKLGKTERIQVSFFGGEPFLAFDAMREYTAMAREILAETGAALKFVVTTNGTGLTPERVEFLEENDFFVGLSVDGRAAAQDASRPFVNGRSSFAVVDAGLRLLVRSAVDFETISVVDPSNVGHLGDTVRYLIETGVRRISLNPNFDADWSDADLERWEAGYRAIAEHYLACYRRGHLVHINVIDDKVLSHIKGGYKPSDHCELGHGAIAVAPSGNIYPCERLVAEDRDATWRIGTVFEGFTSRRGALLAGAGNHNEDCGDCALVHRCMNFCACANLSSSGRYDEPGGLLCWHDQTAIRVADEVASRLYGEQNPMFLQNYYLR